MPTIYIIIFKPVDLGMCNKHLNHTRYIIRCIMTIFIFNSSTLKINKLEFQNI